MREDIRKRIDAVRRGEVPEGYSTERAMLFPNDWDRPVALNTVLSENKDRNEDLRFGKEDVLSVSGEQGIVNQITLLGRSYAGESVAPYHVVETGDVVYTKSPLKESPYGIVKQNRGAPGIVSTLYAVYHCSTPITGQYLENYFRIDTYLNNYLKPLVKRGAKNDMKVNNEDVLLGRIPLPSLQEQERINEIIAQFDRVIDLKQKRVEELKQLKKACLTKMFPKGGTNIPKLRFPGFTDPWEQRKLKDICSVFTDGDWIESKDQSDQGVRLIQTGNVGVTEYLDKSNNKKWVSEDTFERLHCTEVLSGDILISRLPEPAGRACIVPKIGQKMITAVDCTIARIAPEYSSEYVVQYLSTQDYFDEVNNCLAGGTRQRISRGNLSSFLIPLPCSKAEQERIGGFFRTLDDLITLHQRELEVEQQKKKALMKLLLTGLVRVNA